MKSTGLSVQEKQRKIDFQDGGHLGFPIGTILSIFDLQVTPMLPSKLGVNWPVSSGEEAKNYFSKWPPSSISDLHDFSYFLIYKSSQCFLASLESIGLSVQEKKQKIFKKKKKNGRHLGFPIGTIVAVLIFKSPRCFLASLESTGLSVQEKKQKIDFQDSGHGCYLGLLNDFSYF